MRGRAVGLAVTILVAVTGCSSLFGGDAPNLSSSPAAIPPPPTAFVPIEELYGFSFTDDYQSGLDEDDHADIQRKVQACMDEQGWEYTPEAFQEPEDPGANIEGEDDRAETWARNVAERHGFSITLDVLWAAGYTLSLDDLGLNALYADALSDADRDAYIEDLDGCREQRQHHDDQDSFVYASEVFAAEHGELMWALNPYVNVFRTNDTNHEGRIDPLQEEADSAFTACLENVGFGLFSSPAEFRAAYAAELKPRVEAIVGSGEGSTGPFLLPLPDHLIEPVTALLEVETETAVTAVECEIPWEATMRQLREEWAAGYIADNWADIWADIEALRAREDAPVEWLELVERLFGPGA